MRGVGVGAGGRAAAQLGLVGSDAHRLCRADDQSPVRHHH